MRPQFNSQISSLVSFELAGINKTEFRPLGVVLVLLLFLTSPANSYAQQITVDYSQIVNAAPITHSGMTVHGVIERLRKAESYQMSREELLLQRQQVDKWSKEFQIRKRKAESVRLELNSLLQWRLISYEDAKSKYESWVRYTEEAASELTTAKAELARSTGQNQIIRNLQGQIEPFLEPYVFLLEDVLETIQPALRRDLVDIGNLFPEGTAQPAWADLVRTRRFFVLSDGKSYARIFVQGATSESAYKENYGILRHVIGWLWNSTKQHWTVDVYAYQNDLVRQTLKLDPTAYTVQFRSAPPPPVDSVPLDLQGMAEFLRDKHTVEGAYINDQGTLVLYGSKSPKEPTFEGQPIGLADLAVAYRAVAYAGRGDAYVSLDRSPYPEQVNVNFGGRLADTRIGWVVLRSDMRFKTLSDGFDPVTGEERTEEIRSVVRDFKTQAEREVATPNAAITQEFTRYWFSPNEERLVVSSSRRDRLMKISSPRFTGNAVREDEALGNIVQNTYQTPAWTKNTLANLNRNYAAFAKIFPELSELDDVGRLLALFTWLKQENTKLDLDSLLAVEIPECKTPRTKPQMLVSYSFTDRRLRSTNFSQLTEQFANQRPVGNDLITAAFPLPNTTQDLRSEITSSLTKEEQVAAVLQSLSGKRKGFTVIAGGIDLNLARTIAKPRAIPRMELAHYQRLKQSATGEIRVGPNKSLKRATVKPVDLIEQPKVVSFNHSITEPKADPVFGESATTQSFGETAQQITKRSRASELKWSRQGSKTVFSNDNSKLIYYGDNNAPVAFVRYERGTKLSYKLAVNGKTVTAEETISPGVVEEIAVINRSLQRGEATSQTWHKLSEETKVLAFEKVSNNETLILRSEAGEMRLGRYDDKGIEIESVNGEAAVRKMNDISRARIQNASTATIDFVHASTEGDNFILAVGKRSKKVPLSEIDELMKNPSRSEASSIDDLFEVPKNGSRDFIIYRDAFARRPTRFGGSVIEGSVSDPAKLIALFRQRYRDRRILLDDETDTAKANLASLKPITRASEVGLLVPEKTFEIKDYGLIRRIKNNLSLAGVTLVDSPNQLGPLPNVLIVAGHNDSRLIDLLTNLGELGLLKDKVLLLNTCYDKGNPNLFHDLIQKYRPKAVFLHTDKISDVALDPVLKTLGEMLRDMELRGQQIHPADLFERAVDRTLENPNLSDRQRIEINKLRKSALQLSYIRAVEPSIRHCRLRSGCASNG